MKIIYDLEFIPKEGLTLELVTHFLLQYLYVFLCIQTEHKDMEIHIKYRNKKWVTYSKGAPKRMVYP